jgi:hypothetical protein
MGANLVSEAVARLVTFGLAFVMVLILLTHVIKPTMAVFSSALAHEVPTAQQAAPQVREREALAAAELGNVSRRMSRAVASR